MASPFSASQAATKPLPCNGGTRRAGCHGVSKRGIEEISAAVFDAPVALGTVANLEQEVSQALALAYEEAKKAVQEADIKHVDETGWK